MIKKIIFALFAIALCARPFISSQAFPELDIRYSSVLIFLCILLLNKNSLTLYKNPAGLLTLLFFLVVLVSVSFSKDIAMSMSQYYKYSAALFTFLAVRALDNKRKNALIMALFFGSCGLSFLAIRWFTQGTMCALDYLLCHNSKWYFAFEYLSRGRAFAPFTTPAALGGYLILFAPLSLSLLFANKNEPCLCLKVSLRNILALLGVILILLALLASQSLGAIISLALAFGIFSVARNKNSASQIIVSIFIPLLIFLTVFLLLRNSNMYSFNLPWFSITNRLEYWQKALQLISQHPFVGLGVGNYPFFKSISPHNSYLQIWVEAGVLGVFALIGIGYHTLKAAFSNKGSDERLLYNSLWIGNLAFLIHNLIDLTFFLPEVSLLWWAFAAILTAEE